MLIENQSLYSGTVYAMELDIDPESWEKWISTPKHQRPPPNVAFPNLTASEREFILTGIIPEEWEEMTGQWEQADEPWPDDEYAF